MSEQPPHRPVDLTVFGPEHVRLYRETDGEEGYEWNGANVLLLTSKGRRSGEARTIPIMFTPHGDRWSIIALLLRRADNQTYDW